MAKAEPLVVDVEIRARTNGVGTLPRRFVLQRNEDETGVSGVGLVAHGVQFPDGSCVTRWCVTEIRQTSVWDSIEHVRAIHGHGGKTEVVWLDL